MLYRLFFKVVLVRIDAERAHHLAFGVLRALLRAPGARRLLTRFTAPDPVLRTEAFGQVFASPLGVAAGLDKDATLFADLEALGFGSVEIGTVTPHPQPGNPRPRVFRIPVAHALINRMGFPSVGAMAVASAIDAAPPGAAPIGINIGKNRETALEDAADDYREVARALESRANFLVINVSSPNTPGLRDLQAVEPLEAIVRSVQSVLTGCPLLLKISPDLADEDLDAITDLALRTGLAGIVCTNTTIGRDGLPAGEYEPGGLSGAPLRERSLAVLRRIHDRAGDQITLVSVGGVSDAQDVWVRLQAGATLVQAYSGLVYGGPFWARRINREIARLIASKPPRT